MYIPVVSQSKDNAEINRRHAVPPINLGIIPSHQIKKSQTPEISGIETDESGSEIFLSSACEKQKDK